MSEADELNAEILRDIQERRDRRAERPASQATGYAAYESPDGWTDDGYRGRVEWTDDGPRYS